MALNDDLNRLAAQDVVYLTRTSSPPGVATATGWTQVFRGRLRQALNGDWVFNASIGQNGVVGFVLGSVGPNWTSSESPAAGIQITIIFALSIVITGAPLPLQGTMNEVIVLTNVIPTDFAD